jgi:hypothetical protein
MYENFGIIMLVPLAFVKIMHREFADGLHGADNHFRPNGNARVTGFG